MEANRWKQIEQVCHAALALGPEQQAAFLDGACAGDEALRREVESLLAYQKQAELGLLGKTISHYRILPKLGGGGMGAVYRFRRILAPYVTTRRKKSALFGRVSQ